MGYLTWILGLLGAIMLGLVKDEISARMPGLARWCVLRAAERTPDPERWHEEWLAHLEECPGKLGQLAHALGVLFNVWRQGQLRRCRFWFEVLYYFPGIRWSVIEDFIDIVGPTTAVAFFYSWYVSSELAPALAIMTCSFAAFGFLAERKASKLLPRDREMIRLGVAYRKARGLD